MPPFHSRSTGARSTTETSSFGVSGRSGAPSTARASRAQLDRLQRARVDAAARRDAAPRRSRPSSSGAARTAAGARRTPTAGSGSGSMNTWRWSNAATRRSAPRAQHPVAEHVAGHVADADRGERVAVGVLAEHAGVAAHALPRAAGRDAHRLVVVAGAAAGGERVAEPEPVLDGDLVGDVAERRRALVGGDDEVGVVAVVDDRVRRVDDGGARPRCRRRRGCR